MAGCGDVLSLEDLQTAKKHQIFEAEVITGKAGGVAGGATIGTATNPVTGQTQQTLPAVIADANADFDAQILNMGFTRVGTFAAGATLTNPRQTLLWDVADGGDGQEYGWSGAFPPTGKVVPPGSTPLTTGGIAVGAWISRFDPELRIQVREALRRSYAEAGYTLVTGSFEAGGTLVNANDVLLQERTGKAFSGPAGVVAAGTAPTSGGFVDVGDASLRGELAAAGGSGKVGTKLNAIAAVIRTQESVNSDRVSIRYFKDNAGDGTDDTAAFNAAVTHCAITGRVIYLPTPPVKYTISSTIDIIQYCPFEGEAAGLLSIYHGKQGGGSLIEYTGTGPCFHVKPNPTPGTSIRLPFGQMFKNLVFKGTGLASHAIKVSDAANIGVAGMELAGLQIENVFAHGFTSGRGLEIVYCFNNSIKNFVAENCGVVCTLNYAHNTSFFGGSIEQSLVGLDVINSYDVNLHGTAMQGIQASMATTFGLTVPSDFVVWPGWDGSGTSGVLRTVPQDYAGVGVRNLGSVVRWYGGYEEGNNISYVTELNSDTALYGKYVDLDAPVQYFAQFGIGAFAAHDTKFLQGDGVNLVGVFHTERFYADPIDIRNPMFPTSLPEGKKFTGPQIHVGTIENFIPGQFFKKIQYLLTDIEVKDGTVTSGKGFRSTGGFNKEFVETTPGGTSSGVVTKDISSGTTGTNIVHVTNAGDLTITFSDVNRRVAGVPLRVIIINTSTTTPAYLNFHSGDFASNGPGIQVAPQKQRVFIFFFANGTFIQEGVDANL